MFIIDVWPGFKYASESLPMTAVDYSLHYSYTGDFSINHDCSVMSFSFLTL